LLLIFAIVAVFYQNWRAPQFSHFSAIFFIQLYLQLRSYMLAFFLAFGFVAATLLYTVLLIPLKWIVLGRTVPGRYHINSAYGTRYALVQSWCTAPLARMFAVLFANTRANKLLLRYFGANIGSRVLISTLSTMMLAGADQLTIEDEVVLNDDCAILPAVIDGHVLIIDPVDVESSAFIADRAVIMPGSLIGKGAMISLQSFLPKSATIGDGSVWHGSPALCLDPGLNGRQKMETRWHFSMRQLVVNRKKIDEKEETEETSPSSSQSTWKNRVMKFTFVSMLRNATRRELSTPHTDAFSLGALMVQEALDARGNHLINSVANITVPFVFVPLWLFLAFFAPLKLFVFVYQTTLTIPYTAVALGSLALLSGAVFALMLAYNMFYRRLDKGATTDFLFTILGASINLASMFFLDYFKGTRWVAYFFKSIGSRIGKDVYLESILGKDFGLVSVEDNVTIGRDAMAVPVVIRDMHLVYKSTTIQAGTTLGPRSNFSAGSVIEAHSALGPLSTAADGETIDEGFYAEGSPLMHVGEWWDPSKSPPTPSEEALQNIKEMKQDAELDDALRPPAQTGAGKKTPPETVFLTGATGFVGGYILRELLKPERAVKNVICLVRTSSPEAGAERIKDQLIHHELCTAQEWETSMLPRISVLPGDLGKPNLGLSATTLADLADTVDVILNNGALVNVSKGYPTMRSANVDAVHTLLKLCTEGSAFTSMYQISTVGTLPRGTGRLVTEDFEKMDPANLGTGYDQTKWVSEQLILEASKRGLPVALLRLGRMGGDSQTGGANESDYFMLIIKGKKLVLFCFRHRCL
jgi:nucleoside-diphosphate-sugar epimerase/carbonic anhydrase/acetyltransferase-like protein (isoleucine patch superfamily)